MGRRLEGKVAVVTGTGDGIARAVAILFAKEGAKVIGVDIDEAKAQETARLVAEAGGEMTPLAANLMDEHEVNRVMKTAEQMHGGIDIVAHFAMAVRHGDAEHHRVADFSFTLEHVATMTFIVAKHAIPFLKARGGGAMVLAGSIAGDDFGSGFIGNLEHTLSYSVAKGAVIRLGIALANQLGRHGIRVNLVSPGATLTPAGVGFYGAEGSDERRLLIDRQTLLGRISYPDDIAKAALFLASDDAANITGQNLFVDGGYQASGSAGYGFDDVRGLINQLVGEAQPEGGFLEPASAK